MDRPKSRSPAITEARPSSAFPQKHPATSPNVVQLAKVGRIDAILFDKDGTLVDFQRTWGPAVRAVMQHLASGNRAAYDRLVAASRFVEADQRFLPDFPLIAEPTSVFGVRWATALGRPASAEFFAEIDQLLCDATTQHLAAIGDPKTSSFLSSASSWLSVCRSPITPKAPRARARAPPREQISGVRCRI